MKIIGFTHTRNELEQARVACKQHLKHHTAHAVVYESIMAVLMLLGSVCFFGVACRISVRICSLSPVQSNGIVRGLLFLGSMCSFVCFMRILQALICRTLPRAVREGYQTYEHWLDIQYDLRRIADMYSLYEALISAGEEVWLNQARTAIMYVMPPEQKETPPMIKKKVLTEEMGKYLLKDNCITFAYYNERLTKIREEAI